MTFDPSEFLNKTVEGVLDTKLIPVPENMSEEGYQAEIIKVDVRSWVKRDDSSVSGLAADIQWEIQDEAVKTHCGRDKVTCKQGLMLDLTESGDLDMGKGKNIDLGKLRTVLNQNQKGVPWAFSMLEGQMAKIFVSHRFGDEPDADGELPVYAEVKRVGKL